MPLLSGLDIAQRALNAQQFGLDITQQNIANVNTAGYSRLRVNFVPGVANTHDPSQAGSGIAAVSVDSYRNRYIELSVTSEMQGLGEQQVASDALQQVEAVLGDDSGGGLQDALSAFFNSFSSLANTPEDTALRQQVLQNGSQVQDAFHRVYSQVQSVQLQEERMVPDLVKEVNSAAATIASLNSKIGGEQGIDSVDKSTWEDERQAALEQLSQLMDVSYYEDSEGMVSVSTKQGAMLVSGAHTSTLTTASSPPSGFSAVLLDGVNVTSQIQSGELGGALKMRDTTIAGYLNSLDDLAASLISAVNPQHSRGVDLDGHQGGNFFTPFTQPTPGSNAGAARSISVAISDPRAVAAAGPGGATGNNENAVLLAALKDQNLSPSIKQTADQFYASLVSQVGWDGRAAGEGLQTQQNLVQQLQNQRDSFSGVNLDDEAVNIIKYQKAYQASARFISVIDSLSADLLNILGA